MRISREFFYALAILFIIFSSSGGEANEIKKNEPGNVFKERKLAKTETEVNSLMCDPNFIGAIEASLLRLARENLTQLTVNWKRGLVYELEPHSFDVSLKSQSGELVEVIPEKNFLSTSLREESRYIEKVAYKKITQNRGFVFQNKKSFEFHGSFNESGKMVDVYKWNLEQGGQVYSYGLVAPALNNRDISNIYRPLVSHCSEEKVSEFKEKFKPLRFLWSSAGGLSGEKGTMLFKLLRDVLPEAPK